MRFERDGTFDYSRSQTRAASASDWSGMSVRSSADLFAIEHVLAGACLGRDRAFGLLLFLLAAMAGHAALAAGLARLFARPLVSGALLVRRLAALARDLALL